MSAEREHFFSLVSDSLNPSRHNFAPRRAPLVCRRDVNRHFRPRRSLTAASLLDASTVSFADSQIAR